MLRRAYLYLVIVGPFLALLFPPSTVGQDKAASGRVLPPQYQKWLDEDVRYIITDPERAEFTELTTNQQRDEFVEKFWEKRNPDPGSRTNAFKVERYRRLAYANTHFAAKVPGYRTDRGRIYIIYGPPEEREQHPVRTGFGAASAPATSRYPSEVWQYHHIEGTARCVVMKFIDTCECGDYPLETIRTEKH